MRSIHFWYTIITGLLLVYATWANWRRATRTFTHRRPIFWLRFAASTSLVLVFVAGFINNHIAPFPEGEVRWIGFGLEAALFLATLSFISTAKLDQYENEQAQKAIEGLKELP